MINQNQLILLSFGKRGDTGGGDNLAGYCFVLRDLISVNLSSRYTNADLKIFLYVCVHINTMP